MKYRLVTFALLTSAGIGASAALFAQGTEQQQTDQRELVDARQTVEEARRVAEQIVLDARREADQIRSSAAVTATNGTAVANSSSGDLGPVEIRSTPVAVEVAAGTVEEIATAIMPVGWRVLVDVRDDGLLQRRFQYVSTKSRDQALRDLLKPVGLQHQYFFDLKDATGNASPLLVISQR